MQDERIERQEGSSVRIRVGLLDKAEKRKRKRICLGV